MASIMGTAKEVYSQGLRLSKLLVFSYIVDWILILGTAGVGGAFNTIDPSHHSFSLTDLSISYPFSDPETVRTSTLILVSIVAPGIIIAIASLLLVPGPAVRRDIPTSLLWRRKLWEWNVGWMGLGFALAGAFMVTEGLKDLYGKPRPDMLSRCNPDLSDIAAHVVGGLGQELPGAPILVSWTICQNTSRSLSRDGFVSFPSGHASFSWAGMGYLTLWICSKLSVGIPYLSRSPTKVNEPSTSSRVNPREDKATDGHGTHDDSRSTSSQSSLPTPNRSDGAAPPIYMVILAFVPLGVALYISSTRWVDNRHFGFDIICGSLLGIFFAWLGFRLYNPPLTRGSGWAWSARSPRHAFFRGIGVEGWAVSSRYSGSALIKKTDRAVDVEQGVSTDSGDRRSSSGGAAATTTATTDYGAGEGSRTTHGAFTGV